MVPTSATASPTPPPPFSSPFHLPTTTHSPCSYTYCQWLTHCWMNTPAGLRGNTCEEVIVVMTSFPFSKLGLWGHKCGLARGCPAISALNYCFAMISVHLFGQHMKTFFHPAGESFCFLCCCESDWGMSGICLQWITTLDISLPSFIWFKQLVYAQENLLRISLNGFFTGLFCLSVHFHSVIYFLICSSFNWG